LNELRLHYARMAADVGGLSCAFNSTVYQDTLEAVPEIVAWGQKHIDIVNVLVFIAFRAAVVNGAFEYYAGGTRIDFGSVPYATAESPKVDILSTDVLATIQARFPDFRPSAYLNGTEKPDSFKWLLTGRIGTKDRIYGHVGPRFMEWAQVVHHLFRGKYLAYVSPKPLHFQSVMFIQPADILADGRQNMCDGCPDMTVWQDGLAWSCRLEEPMRYGSFVRMVHVSGLPVLHD
jgi:hypothetical protein